MRNSPPLTRSLRSQKLIISLATHHLRMMTSQVLLRLMHPPHAMIFLICFAPLLALILLLHHAHPFAMSFLLLRLTLQGRIMSSSKKQETQGGLGGSKEEQGQTFSR